MRLKVLHTGMLVLACALFLQSQAQMDTARPKLDQEMLEDDKDTLYITNLESINISAPRKFKDNEEYRRYLLYRRYATKVYPYALKAIQVHRAVESETGEMRRRKRKKHIKTVHKELKDEFMDPLKNLSKTQGKILVKMIEKELDLPMYQVIRDLRGGTTAVYWNSLSRLYGYKLKDKYQPGEDRILDAVLNDFDITL